MREVYLEKMRRRPHYWWFHRDENERKAFVQNLEKLPDGRALLDAWLKEPVPFHKELQQNLEESEKGTENRGNTDEDP